jgi:glyoxylase-like metal-dependent hydrolase (beta-lactamase superfamily II)
VLTHGDGDHVGFAERLRTETGARVLVHRDDERLVRESARKDTEASMTSYLWRAAAVRLLAHFARNGGARIPPVAEVSTFEDGTALDVPGRPRALHTPGHTEGECILELSDRGVVLAGDALCTLNPLTGARGPQVMPRAFNVSTARALASLERLAGTDAEVVLPGHGEPWRDGAAEAVERARAVGPT